MIIHSSSKIKTWIMSSLTQSFPPSVITAVGAVDFTPGPPPRSAPVKEKKVQGAVGKKEFADLHANAKVYKKFKNVPLV
jgi:hypothetical protein